MEERCEGCGGTGEISYFKGRSRFLLSRKTCPECDGLGYTTASDEGGEDQKPEEKEGADS